MNDRFFSSLRFYIFCFCLISANLLIQAQPNQPSLPVQVDSMPVIDSLSDNAVAFYAGKMLIAAQIFDSIITTDFAKSRSVRNDLEMELKTAQKDTSVTKVELASMKQRLKNAKALEKVQERHQKLSKQSLTLAQKTVTMDSIGQRKNLASLWKQVLEVQSFLVAAPAPLDQAPPPSSENTPVVTATKPAPMDTSVVQTKEKTKEKEKKTEKPSGPVFKKYDPAADVMLNPPALPCQILSDTRDEFSGQRIRETAPQEIFRYSNPALKKYLQGKVHVIGQASILATGTNIVLRLHFTVNDPNARKAFGKMDKNAAAIFQFIDGTTFTLYNTQTDEGSFDPAGQVATYRAQYSIDDLMLKKLRRTELDKIRVAWANGYDDYEVQQLDVLIHQLKCL